jgi:hypothetical protein
VVGLVATGKGRELFFVGFGLVGAVGVAAWAASIANIWLNRRNPGGILVDLSPHPLAGAVRRSSWLVMAPCALLLLSEFQTVVEGHVLFPAVMVALGLLMVLTILMYSDRVWIAERGLYLGGRLYPWFVFERVAWTDDGRAFAIRSKDPLPLQALVTFRHWTVVPVPEGSR